MLFDDDTLVRDFLDGGDEQRGLFEFLVLVCETFEFLLVLVVLGVGVEEFVAHLLVLRFEDLQPFLERLDFLLLGRLVLVVWEVDVVHGVTHYPPFGCWFIRDFG